MFGIVYLTHNLINGMKYIGQHQCTDENDSYLGSGSLLVQDVKIYGRENFRRITLYKAESTEELNEMEIAFIKAVHADESPNYYNIAKGGDCIEGEMNPMYGHVYTEEERNKISDRVRGEKHWNYGKHWSEATKEKMRHPHNGNADWAAHVKRTTEHSKHISEAKKGKKPSYSKEQREEMSRRVTERNHTAKFREQVSNANRVFHEAGGRRGAKQVLCVETGVVYASIADAGKCVNVHSTSISACLNGKQVTAAGYHWRFATAEEISKGAVCA